MIIIVTSSDDAYQLLCPFLSHALMIGILDSFTHDRDSCTISIGEYIYTLGYFTSHR